MRSQNWIVLTAMLAGVCHAATASAVAVEQAEAVTSASVVNLDGKIATADDITSFAAHLEMSEGRALPTQQDLLDEYILTQLYDKIPTTATLAQDAADVSSPSSVPGVSQRTLLKRELQKLVSTDVEVPQEIMAEWYQKNVERYTQPERVHAYHLFRKPPIQPP